VCVGKGMGRRGMTVSVRKKEGAEALTPEGNDNGLLEQTIG